MSRVAAHDHGDEPTPRILVRRSRVKRDRSPAPGVGARVLMRVEFDANAGLNLNHLLAAFGAGHFYRGGIPDDLSRHQCAHPQADANCHCR